MCTFVLRVVVSLWRKDWSHVSMIVLWSSHFDNVLLTCGNQLFCVLSHDHWAISSKQCRKPSMILPASPLAIFVFLPLQLGQSSSSLLSKPLFVFVVMVFDKSRSFCNSSTSWVEIPFSKSSMSLLNFSLPPLTLESRDASSLCSRVQEKRLKRLTRSSFLSFQFHDFQLDLTALSKASVLVSNSFVMMSKFCISWTTFFGDFGLKREASMSQKHLWKRSFFKVKPEGSLQVLVQKGSCLVVSWSAWAIPFMVAGISARCWFWPTKGSCVSIGKARPKCRLLFLSLVWCQTRARSFEPPLVFNANTRAETDSWLKNVFHRLSPSEAFINLSITENTTLRTDDLCHTLSIVFLLFAKSKSLEPQTIAHTRPAQKKEQLCC